MRREMAMQRTAVTSAIGVRFSKWVEGVGRDALALLACSAPITLACAD